MRCCQYQVASKLHSAAPFGGNARRQRPHVGDVSPPLLRRRRAARRRQRPNPAAAAGIQAGAQARPLVRSACHFQFQAPPAFFLLAALTLSVLPLRSVLSNFAFSFSMISVLAGVTTTYNTGLRYGGPASMTLGWLVVATFNGCVALSIYGGDLLRLPDLRRPLLLERQALRRGLGVPCFMGHRMVRSVQISFFNLSSQ